MGSISRSLRSPIQTRFTMSEPFDDPLDPRLIFLEGKHVKLKVLTKRDVYESGWIGWFNDVEHCRYAQHHYYPNSVESQLAILDGCISKEKIQLGIIDKTDPGEIVGIVTLQNIDMLNRNCEIAASICRKASKKNPNIFFDAWSLMMAHGFRELGLRKMYGGTFGKGYAKMLVRMFNFEIEGVLKQQIFKSGKFEDVTLVGVFDDTVAYYE